MHSLVEVCIIARKKLRKNAVNLQDLALENRSADFNNIPQELSESEFMHL
jgi:hypothetical protein